MNNISKYDQQQLKQMQECLFSFQKNQIQLSSLIGSLEFLFNAMESVDEEWENKFLKEITILESVNAVELMEEAERKKMNYKKNESSELVNQSVLNLKNLIQNKLQPK
jgi:hypothetical protein